MGANFDELTPAQLRGHSLKWTRVPEGVLAAWVAEMDYPTAPEVRAAIEDVVKNNEFGYPAPESSTALSEACASFQARRHGWTIDPERVHALPDALIGLVLGVEHYSAPESPVVITPPAYPNFYTVAENLGREVIEVEMTEDGKGRAVLDLGGIDDALKAGAGTVILCNPNNPLGRSHTKAELLALCEVVERNRARVVSDELHAPLTYTEQRHVPYASVSEAAASHTVTVLGAAKGWNISGLKMAQVVLSNDADEKIWSEIPSIKKPGTSTVANAANAAAWDKGEAWLDEVVAYLDRNRRRLGELVSSKLPGVGYVVPEGTYLGWLDCRGLGLEVAPSEFFLEQAKVLTVNGAGCGTGGAGHVRFNFATSAAILEEMLDRMGAALEAR